jgi:hypothetical protein
MGSTFQRGTLIVMAGLDPAIHVFGRVKAWIPGTSPGMTVEGVSGVITGTRPVMTRET